MKTLQITKRNNYYQVKFDTGLVLKLLEPTVIEFSLIKPKIEVSDEMLEKILARNEYYTCLNYGMNYLANLHSRKETFMHLSKKYSKEVSLEVVKKLIELNLINDLEYANAYLQYCYKNNKGPELCKLGLYNEDIPYDVIMEVMPNYTLEMEEAACSRAISKQVLNYKKETYKSSLNKLNIFLKNRGFSSKVIGLCIEKNAHLLDNVIDEEKLLENTYLKLYRSYSKKYQGKELKTKLTNALYRKGFALSQIKKILESRDNND